MPFGVPLVSFLRNIFHGLSLFLYAPRRNVPSSMIYHLFPPPPPAIIRSEFIKLDDPRLPKLDAVIDGNPPPVVEAPPPHFCWLPYSAVPEAEDCGWGARSFLRICSSSRHCMSICVNIIYGSIWKRLNDYVFCHRDYTYPNRRNITTFKIFNQPPIPPRPPEKSRKYAPDYIPILLAEPCSI